MSSAPLLTAIAFHPRGSGWDEAVRLCCRPLLDGGYISRRYVRAIIDDTRRSGPRYLLSPGFALPHARPDAGVLSRQTHPSLLRLRDAVLFPPRQPVNPLIGLAAADGERHIRAIGRLLNWLDEDNKLIRLQQADNAAQLRAECAAALSG